MPNINKIQINNVTYDLGSNEDIELPIDYNTVYDINEHQIGWYAVTGGYKPVYRKVIDLGNNITISKTDFDLDVTKKPNNMQNPIQSQLILVNSSNNSVSCVPCKIRSDAETFKCLSLDSFTASSAAQVYLILEYTKTTDTVVTEISKQTIPAVKYTEVQKQEEVYDGQERVIGTWFGKPLYRKTFTLTFSASSQVANNIFTGSIDLTAICPNIETGFFIRDKSLFYDGTDLRGFISGFLTDSSTLTVMTQYSRSNADGTFTIEYTKTTDTVE